MAVPTGQDKQGIDPSDVDERVARLEKRLDELLSGKVELEVQDLSVAPRSKLRVSCE